MLQYKVQHKRKTHDFIGATGKEDPFLDLRFLLIRTDFNNLILPISLIYHFCAIFYSLTGMEIEAQVQ